MNAALKAYRQRTRQTASMKLTDRINAAVTPENIRLFNATADQLVFCANTLGVSLQSDSGEKAAIRLENKLLKASSK